MKRKFDSNTPSSKFCIIFISGNRINGNTHPYDHYEPQSYALTKVTDTTLFGKIKHAIASLRDILNSAIYGVDRQGIPSIPPGLALVGFSTGVAVAGVATQTGIRSALLNAISNILSKLRIHNQKFS